MATKTKSTSNTNEAKSSNNSVKGETSVNLTKTDSSIVEGIEIVNRELAKNNVVTSVDLSRYSEEVRKLAKENNMTTKAALDGIEAGLNGDDIVDSDETGLDEEVEMTLDEEIEMLGGENMLNGITAADLDKGMNDATKDAIKQIMAGISTTHFDTDREVSEGDNGVSVEDAIAFIEAERSKKKEVDTSTKTYKVLYLHSLGYTNGEIARSQGMRPQHVSNIVCGAGKSGNGARGGGNILGFNKSDLIRDLIGKGLSDGQILAYMKAKYEGITLSRPEINGCRHRTLKSPF
jgi:hypothetical protein